MAIKKDTWILLPGNNIAAAAWDSARDAMLVRFKNGWEYVAHCPFANFIGLVEAGGSRTYYDTYIKDVYHVVRIP